MESKRYYRYEAWCWSRCLVCYYSDDICICPEIMTCY